MSLSRAQRQHLVANLAGPQPVDCRHLSSLRGLQRHGLLVLQPRGSTRPQSSRLTPRGRREAQELAVAELQAAE